MKIGRNHLHFMMFYYFIWWQKVKFYFRELWKSPKICTTNVEFLEILLSKLCQHFPPHPPLSPERLCHNQRETTFVARRNRRSGDEALERKPFIVQLRGSKPMKRIQFLRRLITHTFKRPHSKAEEPDCLFRRDQPSLMIATQSPKAGKRDRVRGWFHWFFLLAATLRKD